MLDESIVGLSEEEKEQRMNEIIAQNQQLAGDGELGTTPRKLVNLVGSAMDLASGSGNKGTPAVLVHGYFDTRVNEEMNLEDNSFQKLYIATEVSSLFLKRGYLLQ